MLNYYYIVVQSKNRPIKKKILKNMEKQNNDLNDSCLVDSSIYVRSKM